MKPPRSRRNMIAGICLVVALAIYVLNMLRMSNNMYDYLEEYAEEYSVESTDETETSTDEEETDTDDTVDTEDS